MVPLRVRAAGDAAQRQQPLREQYEQQNLRQRYAADDTNVPTTSVVRVNQCASALSYNEGI